MKRSIRGVEAPKHGAAAVRRAATGGDTMNRSVAVVCSAAIILMAGVFIQACNKNSSNPVSPVPGADVTITIAGINGNMSFSRSEEHTSELQSHVKLVCR